MGACTPTQSCTSSDGAKIIIKAIGTCAPTEHYCSSAEHQKMNKARLLLQDSLDSLTVGDVDVLDLEGNGGGDGGVVLLARALQENTSLQHLSLRWSGIGVRGAEALAGVLRVNRTLQSLDLFCNSVRDAGAQALAQSLVSNRSLKSLDVGWNSIACGGACAFASTLKANCSLECVGLERNAVEERGAAAIAEALWQNLALTTLRLAGNPLGEAAALALVEASTGSPRLVHFDLVPPASALQSARSLLSLSGLSIPEDEDLKDEFAPAAPRAIALLGAIA